MAGRYKLDLTSTRKGPHRVARAFPYVCGACGIRYMAAAELVKHMCEQRGTTYQRDSNA